jgi:hypothetical protein
MVYTKKEVSQVCIAYEFIRTRAYPSMEEAVRLLEDGNLQNVPNNSQADIIRAFQMYGRPAEYIRGKLTK